MQGRGHEDKCSGQAGPGACQAGPRRRGCGPGEERRGMTTASPITDARLQSAYDHWCRIAAGRPMPQRRDLDPADIPRLLPHVMLVDVDDGRYRYRLIGTANAQEHGMNATGRYVDEVLKGPEYRTHALGLYDDCARGRRPVYSESLFLSPT